VADSLEVELKFLSSYFAAFLYIPIKKEVQQRVEEYSPGGPSPRVYMVTSKWGN
jgi:hypothetical protein